MKFEGKNYVLNQYRELREDDDNPLNPLFDWLQSSNVGEYTKHYRFVIFHAERGFIAAYSDSLDNNCAI